MSTNDVPPGEKVESEDVPHADGTPSSSPDNTFEEVTGDAVAEAADGEADATPETAADLQSRVQELEKALEHQRDLVLRAQADLDNTRRRAQRDVEQAHKYGLEKFVTEMLPVADSMELGLHAAGQEGAALEQLCEGMDLTLKMLQSALGKFDVEIVDPVDAPFDPELHQAMTMQAREGVESGIVLQVFQKGYKLSGRLVRPAMVVVST